MFKQLYSLFNSLFLKNIIKKFIDFKLTFYVDSSINSFFDLAKSYL